jgi:acetylornithine deacetylase/succinyl-diaminopimelate desuccinylase-like protein
MERRTRRKRLRAYVIGVAILTWSVAAGAAEVDWQAIEREAASFLSEYIKIDTTNPPGNEIAAAEFLAARFRSEGIETQLFDSGGGRGSVVARLRGTGASRPVVLLNHLDVVPADPEGWKQPPFSGVISDGHVHGRGAIDCKGLGVVEAMALLVLKRTGVKLTRDVVFLGTADEEAGGKNGAGWFVEKHFADLGNPEFVLNEGGAIRSRPGARRAYEVAVAEKTPFWLRMTARGEAGHGSTPRGESAVTRLIRALDRARRFETGIQIVPEVDRYYSALAEAYEDKELRARYASLRETLKRPLTRKEFLKEPQNAALVQNTIAITVLQGSSKTNVIPSTAYAELDCRLLPGEDPDTFLERLKTMVADPSIEFSVLLHFPPSSSDVGTPLYRAIEQVAKGEESPVVPSVLRGFTDSHFFRERGVTSYGFIPVVLTEEDERTVHGQNERISLESLREGTRRLVEILQTLDQLDRGE